MQVNSDTREMPMSVMSTKQGANDGSFHYSEKRPHTAVRVVVSIGRWPQRAGVIADSSLRVSAISKMPTGVQRDLGRKKLTEVLDRREATAPPVHTAGGHWFDPSIANQ